MKNLNIFLLCMFCSSFMLAQAFDYQGELSPESLGEPYFQSLGGIDYDSKGNIYVVDPLGKKVKKLDAQGQFLLQFGIGGSADGQFLNPIDVAVDENNHVYVLDANAREVQKFDSNGNFIARFGNSDFQGATGSTMQGIAADNNGNIYVVYSFFTSRMIRFNLSGELVNEIDLPEVMTPSGLAFGRDGKYYISDQAANAVHIYNADNSLNTTLTMANMMLFATPEDVDVDANGNIFIADRGNQRLVRYAADLMSSTFYNGAGVNPSFLGVAVSPVSNEIATTETSSQQLHLLENNLTFINDLGRTSLTGNLFGQPRDIAIAADGTMYVVDGLSGVVKKYLADGSYDGSFNIATSVTNPVAVGVDTLDHVFVASNSSGVISRFSTAGDMENATATANSIRMNDMYVAPNGDHLQVMLDTNTTSRKVGYWEFQVNEIQPSLQNKYGTNNTGMLAPYGIDRDEQGRTVLTDVYRHAVFLFDEDDDYVRHWGSLGSGDNNLDTPSGVAFDHQGNILVVDRGNNRIQKFDATGNLIASYGGPGSNFGQFSSPTGLTVGPNGDIYVVDTGNNRIQILRTCQVESAIEASICANEPYNFNGTLVDTTGTYVDTLITEMGCDSIITLNLMVTPLDTVKIETAICAGDSLLFNGTYLKVSTQDTITMPSLRTDCDSTTILNLMVNDTFNIDTTVVGCRGSMYPFGDMMLSDTDAGNTHTFTFMTANGCDSTVNLTYTVLDTFRTIRVDTICMGDTLLIGDSKYFQAGVYQDTFPGSMTRCDSIVSTTLTVLDTFRTMRMDTICVGDTLFVGDEKFFETGAHLYVYPRNTERCDSTVDISLTVLDTFRTMRMDTICMGDTLFVGDGKFFETGAHLYVYPRNTERCDSTIDISLTVLDTFHIMRMDTICMGDTLFVGDQKYFQTGDYSYNFLRNTERCDSIIDISLTVLDTFFTPRMDTICIGDTLFIGDLKLTTDGTYRYTYPRTETRCDSTVEVQLTTLPGFRTVLNDTICGGTTYSFEDLRLTATGQYEYVYPKTAIRCDSVIEINLVVNPAYNQTFDTTICEGQTFELEGQRLSTSGMLSHTYQTAAGCDSVVTYEVSVLDTFMTRLDVTICAGQRFDIGNTGFASTGKYFYTFPPTDTRCDSTIELNLTVTDTFFVEVQDTICEGAVRQLGPLSLSSSGTYQYTFPANDMRCDSTVHLELVVNQPVYDTTTVQLCSGQSLVFNNITVESPGTYDVALTAANGCDSLIRLTVEDLQTQRTFLSADICESEPYNFNGVLLDSTGIYMDTLVAANGCDSIVALNLTVTPTIRTTLNRTICQGDSYTFDDEQLTEPGIYRDTFTAQTGCNLIIELNLTVNPSYSDTTYATICANEFYPFQGNIYTDSGLYEFAFSTAEGCDSMRFLDLQVLPSYSNSLEVNLCRGDTFLLGERKLYEPGDYLDTLQAQNGCDSIVAVSIDMGITYSDTLDINICTGGGYAFGDTLLYESGTYADTTQTSEGCDSITVINLQLEQMDTSVVRGGILLSANAEDVDYQWIDCQDSTMIEGANTQFFVPSANGSYAVILTTDSCTYVSPCYSVLVTGTKEEEISYAIGLYPNPTYGDMTLDLAREASGEYQLRIVDLNGKLLYAEQKYLQGQHRLQTAQLPPGMYWLLLKDEEGRVARMRFVKQ